MARGVSVLRIFVLAALIYLSLYLALVFHLNRSEWAEKELDSGIQRQHKIRLAIEYPTQDKLSRSLNSIDKKANDKSLPSEALGDKTADHNSAVNATEDESLATKNSIDSSIIPSELTINTSLCDGPFPGYPECKGKTRWMSEFWESDPCYAVKGVDGTQCSFVQYLSEVEHWCPVLPWRKHLVMKEERKITSPTLDLSPLLNLLSQTSKFDWIRQRIIHFWPKWVKAAKAIEKRQPFFHTEKSILLYIGALSDKSGYHFAENAFSGGPLGEMVQWSDLISALYVSGHSLEFGTELTHLKEMLSVTKGIGGCPTSSEVKYDTIFIDITGLRQFRSIAKGRFQHYMCLFRVLDSFGTEPTYNYKPWKPSNHHGDHGQAWGNWGLNLRQFMTMFPHTPDNSFLGFAVDVDLEEDEELVKENQALVYGKEAYMWKEKDNYLDTISRYLNVHGTVSFKSPRDDESRIPGFVVNHGILNSTALVRLLKRSKVFVGLGFPYEGPAALEAVAYGCVFLNPRIDPPMHRENTKFFQKKPTDRALTSQHPYAETMIGSPHVRTIDIGDLKKVDKVLEEILKEPLPPPYLPYEFSMEGMLERLLVYLENQDFCHPKQWPPLEELKVVVSDSGHDCKATCYSQGLVCEPEYFSAINDKESIQRATGSVCRNSAIESSVHGPSLSDGGACSVQAVPLLLGCVGSQPGIRRICPCRTYNKGQISLCSSCHR